MFFARHSCQLGQRSGDVTIVNSLHIPIVVPCPAPVRLLRFDDPIPRAYSGIQKSLFTCLLHSSDQTAYNLPRIEDHRRLAVPFVRTFKAPIGSLTAYLPFSHSDGPVRQLLAMKSIVGIPESGNY